MSKFNFNFVNIVYFIYFIIFRELDLKSKFIINMKGNKTSITNMKVLCTAFNHANVSTFIIVMTSKFRGSDEKLM